MIAALIDIKKIKAERAEHALNKQQQVLTQINSRLQQAHQQVTDYQDWRKGEEKQLFEQAKEACLKLKELEALQQHIALLHDKEAALRQDVAEVELKRDKEHEILALKRKDLLLANKTMEKFAILKQQDDIEQEYLSQYQEELELEDRRIMSTGELPC